MANINVTSRVVPNFPAKVQGSGGVDVDTTNGVYTISLDLDQFSNQEGSILYRGPTSWVALLRGQNGQVLKSTSTSIEWGTSSADQTFVGTAPIDVNTVGSTTTTSIDLNFYSNNQGALITRNGAAWIGLDKGTTGQVLKVAASGDLAWEDESAGGAGERNVVWCGVATGTVNDIVLTPAPAITAYAPNVIYAFIPSGTNTTAMTANISDVGAVSITNSDAALIGGEVSPPKIYYLQLNEAAAPDNFHIAAAELVPATLPPTDGTVTDQSVSNTLNATQQTEFRSRINAAEAGSGGGGGLTWTGFIASSGSSSIDVTGIPSGVNEIVMAMYTMGTGGITPILVQLGHSGGYITSGYETTHVRQSTNNVFTAGTDGWLMDPEIATPSINGILRIVRNKETTPYQWTGVLHTGRSTANTIFVSAGTLSEANVIDRIRITSRGGDLFTAGAIRVGYG